MAKLAGGVIYQWNVRQTPHLTLWAHTASRLTDSLWPLFLHHNQQFSLVVCRMRSLHYTTWSPECKVCINNVQCVWYNHWYIVQCALKSRNGTFVDCSWNTVQCFSWFAPTPLSHWSLYILTRLTLDILESKPFLHFCQVAISQSIGNMLCIPHICRGHHGQCPCKKNLSSVKFSRLNAENCIFYTFWGYLL